MKSRYRLLIVCVLSLPLFTGCGEEDESASLEETQGEQSQPTELAPNSMASDSGETTAPAPISTTPGPQEVNAPAPIPAFSEPTGSTVVAGKGEEAKAANELAGEVATLEAKLVDLENKMLDKSQHARTKLIENLESLREEQERLQDKAEELQAAGVGAMQALMQGLNDKLSGMERQIELDEEAD